MSFKQSELILGDYSYVIGIDFGTTYSGCSYTFIEDKEDQFCDIQSWPRGDSNKYQKVPTVLLYDQTITTAVAWGYDALRKSLLPGCKDVLVKRFKLCLDPETKDSINLPSQLTTFQVISDYLGFFHKHILSEISRRLGKVYDPNRFRYSLTVPAAWDDSAKSIMRRAAIKAGIIAQNDHPARLVLTSEPEAASLFCQNSSKEFDLGHGDRFMICDAGGGTVDLIVFEIKETNGSKTLQEITKGSGKSCGSTFLDIRMQNILEKRLGKHSKTNNKAVEFLLNHFITMVKPQFENEDDAYFPLPHMRVSDIELKEIGEVDGTLPVLVQELKEQVFDPVIDQVLELISDQLDNAKDIGTIFLVGGFGQSKYLLKRIKEVFGSKVASIFAPSRGEMAVTRGAVLYGVDPAVITQRVARRTYGICTDALYDPTIDLPIRKVVMSDGSVRAINCFQVYVKKGDVLVPDQCVSQDFYIFYPNHSNSDLYAYDGDGPPPRYTDSPGVRRITKFPIATKFIPNTKVGAKVPIKTIMYFGQTEIMVKSIIGDQTFVYSSSFDTHME
ncbi:hypothetical protein CLU79DRAFT_744308 [Phycomyces nitens]|nr:hypothetical protein CLU79DRAFT_744308 [Phycomyces nitens]